MVSKNNLKDVVQQVINHRAFSTIDKSLFSQGNLNDVYFNLSPDQQKLINIIFRNMSGYTLIDLIYSKRLLN